jgi:DNA-binding IclR family transcriptional regulator
VSSRAFITTLSARVLRETKATRHEVQQLKREFEPIREKEIEKEPQEVAALSVSVTDVMSLGEDAKKVLKALASDRFTLRTRTGIANDTGIDKDAVNKILDDLVERRLVRKVKVMVQDELKTRWYLTQKGRALSLSL